MLRNTPRNCVLLEPRRRAMEVPMRKKKTLKPKARRIHKIRRKNRESADRLVALAAEPVEPGTGQQTFGRGAYAYVKCSTFDPEAMHIFRFRSRKDLERAHRAGIAADLVTEGRLDELESVLEEGIANAEFIMALAEQMEFDD